MTIEALEGLEGDILLRVKEQDLVQGLLEPPY